MQTITIAQAMGQQADPKLGFRILRLDLAHSDRARSRIQGISHAASILQNIRGRNGPSSVCPVLGTEIREADIRAPLCRGQQPPEARTFEAHLQAPDSRRPFIQDMGLFRRSGHGRKSQVWLPLADWPISEPRPAVRS